MMLYIPIIRNPIIISCVHTYRYRKRLPYHVATTSLCHPGCPTLVHAIAGYHLRPGGEGPHPMNWHWLVQIGSNGVRFIVLSWFVRLSTQFWRKFDFTFRGKRRTGGEKALMAVLWKALKKRKAGIIQYRKEFTSKFQISSHPQNEILFRDQVSTNLAAKKPCSWDPLPMKSVTSRQIPFKELC